MKDKIMTYAKGHTTKAAPNDVIKLLKADHEKVRSLFDEFEKLRSKNDNPDKKSEIVQEICHELTLHAMAEESIVYPAARDSIEDEDLMDEADVEHAVAKELIAELQDMDVDESHYDAKVTVLREYIEHHVKEEESKMFPKLVKSEIDGEEMAAEVMQFKEDHKNDDSTSPAKKKTHAAKKSSVKQTKKASNGQRHG